MYKVCVKYVLKVLKESKCAKCVIGMKQSKNSKDARKIVTDSESMKHKVDGRCKTEISR